MYNATSDPYVAAIAGKAIAGKTSFALGFSKSRTAVVTSSPMQPPFSAKTAR